MCFDADKDGDAEKFQLTNGMEQKACFGLVSVQLRHAFILTRVTHFAVKYHQNCTAPNGTYFHTVSSKGLLIATI